MRGVGGTHIGGCHACMTMIGDIGVGYAVMILY